MIRGNKREGKNCLPNQQFDTHIKPYEMRTLLEEYWEV